jgi:hypothetical protein
MSSCLSEEALLRASLGEGAREERAHLDGCARCRRRAEQWALDLGTIGSALRAAPPLTVAQRRWAVLRPALAVAALLALALTLWLRPGQRAELAAPPIEQRTSVAVSRYASEVSAAVFDPRFSRHGAASAGPSELMQALDSGAPCTGRRFAGDVCNDYTSALFF